jgi:hypothetical protein
MRSRSAAAQDEAASRAPPDAGAKLGGAERGAPAGAASLHRVTPAPTDQAGTLYRKGRRSDSGLLPLPEGALASEPSGVSEPSGASSQAPRAPGPGAGGERGGGAPAAAGAAGREPAPGRAGQGEAREGAGEGHGEEAVYGTGPGSPAAAAAGQFWLSAAAAGTGPGQGVASHRVELSGACRRTPAPSMGPVPSGTCGATSRRVCMLLGRHLWVSPGIPAGARHGFAACHRPPPAAACLLLARLVR